MIEMESWKEELYHHGILGQKWGVRRYQNEDGTLTSAGRRRLNESDYKKINSSMKSASEISKSASNIAKRSAEKKRKKAMDEMDLSEMSDKELQEVINRLNLEKNYKSLKTENIATGADYVSSILSTAGDVVAIGASIASIAMAIHTIKG